MYVNFLYCKLAEGISCINNCNNNNNNNNNNNKSDTTKIVSIRRASDARGFDLIYKLKIFIRRGF